MDVQGFALLHVYTVTGNQQHTSTINFDPGCSFFIAALVSDVLN
jgi:hypothetical protein